MACATALALIAAPSANAATGSLDFFGSLSAPSADGTIPDPKPPFVDEDAYGDVYEKAARAALERAGFTSNPILEEAAQRDVENGFKPYAVSMIRVNEAFSDFHRSGFESLAYQERIADWDDPGTVDRFQLHGDQYGFAMEKPVNGWIRLVIYSGELA